MDGSDIEPLYPRPGRSSELAKTWHRSASLCQGRCLFQGAEGQSILQSGRQVREQIIALHLVTSSGERALLVLEKSSECQAKESNASSSSKAQAHGFLKVY